MRTRGGVSAPMEKRSRWPHPGQTTVKDDVAAEGWLIEERDPEVAVILPLDPIASLPALSEPSPPSPLPVPRARPPR